MSGIGIEIDIFQHQMTVVVHENSAHIIVVMLHAVQFSRRESGKIPIEVRAVDSQHVVGKPFNFCPVLTIIELKPASIMNFLTDCLAGGVVTADQRNSQIPAGKSVIFDKLEINELRSPFQTFNQTEQWIPFPVPVMVEVAKHNPFAVDDPKIRRPFFQEHQSRSISIKFKIMQILKQDRAIHGHPIHSGSQNQFRGSCFPAVNNRSIERINVVRSLFTDTEFRGMNNRPAGRSRKLHLEFPGTDRQLAEITFPWTLFRA